MSTTHPPQIRDGAREKELEELGVLDPVVEWLDNDLVVVTMRRQDLDRLTGEDHERAVSYGYHHDDDCDHVECSGYDDGWDEGHAKAIADIQKLADAA